MHAVGRVAFCEPSGVSPRPTAFMYLLYADTSGNVGGDTDRHFVLGAVAIKESGVYHVIRELDAIVADSPLRSPDLELHGNEIVRGRNLWRRILVEERIAFFKRCLGVFHGNSRGNLRCFGIVIEKESLRGRNPVELSFEQVCARFNRYLERLNLRSAGRGQHRGLMIFDESKYEGELQSIAASYRVNGTRWGHLRNLAEVPLFADSQASRLIQLADLVSYALWQRYERSDDQYLNAFISAFDHDAGTIHGLYHQRAIVSEPCLCPACASRPQGRRALRARQTESG